MIRLTTQQFCQQYAARLLVKTNKPVCTDLRMYNPIKLQINPITLQTLKGVNNG